MTATPPNTRVQRTRSSPSAHRSPLTRCPLGRPTLEAGTSRWTIMAQARSPRTHRGLSWPRGGFAATRG